MPFRIFPCGSELFLQDRVGFGRNMVCPIFFGVVPRVVLGQVSECVWFFPNVGSGTVQLCCVL